MPISATTPTTVNATYDKWAFMFATNGTGCVAVGQPASAAQSVSARVMLHKARVRDDGAWEQSPNPDDVKEIVIADIYGLAASNPDVATALANLIAAVESVGQEQGAL